MYDHPVAWAASPGADDPWWAEWDLSRNCTWLTSPGVGISDEAPSGSRYIFYVLTDGSYKWQKAISLGHSDGLKVSIKGALRLRLSAAALQNAYGVHTRHGAMRESGATRSRRIAKTSGRLPVVNVAGMRPGCPGTVWAPVRVCPSQVRVLWRVPAYPGAGHQPYRPLCVVTARLLSNM